MWRTDPSSILTQTSLPDTYSTVARSTLTSLVAVPSVVLVVVFTCAVAAVVSAKKVASAMLGRPRYVLHCSFIVCLLVVLAAHRSMASSDLGSSGRVNLRQ